MIINSRLIIVTSAFLFSAIATIHPMDPVSSVRVALITYRYRDGQNHEYTHDNLAHVLTPAHFSAMEKDKNGDRNRIAFAYQIPWYDKRQASLAADFLLHDVPLKNNIETANLVSELPLLNERSLNRMAHVLALGNMAQILKPYFKIASTQKCVGKDYVERAILYCVAIEGLKLAYNEGKDLIDEMAYVKTIKPQVICLYKSDGSTTVLM